MTSLFSSIFASILLFFSLSGNEDELFLQFADNILVSCSMLIIWITRYMFTVSFTFPEPQFMNNPWVSCC